MMTDTNSSSNTKIEVAHIEEKLGQNIERASREEIYVAFCEAITTVNPSYSLESLAEEWKEGEFTSNRKRTFAERKFQDILSSEIKKYITINDKEKWVKATIDGIRDVAYERDKN